MSSERTTAAATRARRACRPRSASGNGTPGTRPMATHACPDVDATSTLPRSVPA